jgi:hypothetical protein
VGGRRYGLTRLKGDTIFTDVILEASRGATEMPIKRYVETGVVFAPQALSAMGKALEETSPILGIEGDEKKRQAVAKFIVRLAKEDDSLDAATLRDRAVAALGGIAYSATIPFSPQPSNSHAAAE